MATTKIEELKAQVAAARAAYDGKLAAVKPTPGDIIIARRDAVEELEDKLNALNTAKDIAVGNEPLIVALNGQIELVESQLSEAKTSLEEINAEAALEAELVAVQAATKQLDETGRPAAIVRAPGTASVSFQA